MLSKKFDLVDGLAVTMSRYVTKCSRDQVLGLRPDLRKVDKLLWNKWLKLFLNEYFDYRTAFLFLSETIIMFCNFVCSFDK